MMPPLQRRATLTTHCGRFLPSSTSTAASSTADSSHMSLNDFGFAAAATAAELLPPEPPTARLARSAGVILANADDEAAASLFFCNRGEAHGQFVECTDISNTGISRVNSRPYT